MGSQRGTHWSVTINNPTEEDYTEIELMKSQKWFKKWEGQLEQGENGTPHIQAHLHTEYMRWGTVKGALSRAHIEKAENQFAIANYVHKPETRIAELPTQVGLSFMTITKFYQVLARHVVDELVRLTKLDRQDVVSALRGIDLRNEDRLSQAVTTIDPLTFADEVAGNCIANGAHGLEFIISNPLTRSTLKKFFWPCVKRELEKSDAIV